MPLPDRLRYCSNMGQHQSKWKLEEDTALDKNPLSIICRVSIAVSSALYQLHLAVEAFRYSVIFCKPPHPDYWTNHKYELATLSVPDKPFFPNIIPFEIGKTPLVQTKIFG